MTVMCPSQKRVREKRKHERERFKKEVEQLKSKLKASIENIKWREYRGGGETVGKGKGGQVKEKGEKGWRIAFCLMRRKWGRQRGTLCLLGWEEGSGAFIDWRLRMDALGRGDGDRDDIHGTLSTGHCTDLTGAQLMVSQLWGERDMREKGLARGEGDSKQSDNAREERGVGQWESRWCWLHFTLTNCTDTMKASDWNGA